MDEGTDELQRYLDSKVSAPLNAALNSLAEQRPRPEEPLRYLAAVLDTDVKAPRYTPVAICKGESVMKELAAAAKRGGGVSAEEVVQALLKAGALVPIVPRTRDSREDASLLEEMSAPMAKAVPPTINHARALWQKALKPALRRRQSKEVGWMVTDRPTELCRRWDYDAGADTWKCSETLVKMEADSFAKGAMRECYRMKKMSQVNPTFFFNMNWESCNNYVAKRYMLTQDGAQPYFDDIKMQMISKRYARLYNALSPPKGVDFLQAFVMEIERKGETLTFAVERAMEEELSLIHI